MTPPTFRGLTTERTKDLLTLAWAWLSQKHKAGQGSPAEAHLVDISQCLSRHPWGTKVRSLTTLSQIYSFAAQRVLSPEEHFLLLGLAPDALPRALAGLGTHAVRKRAGEAMALPNFAVAATALLTAMGIGAAV